MQRNLFFVVLALLGLCGGIYAQMSRTSEDWEFCKAHCQPNDTGSCAMYTVGNEGGYGDFSCGTGAVIYDSEPPVE